MFSGSKIRFACYNVLHRIADAFLREVQYPKAHNESQGKSLQSQFDLVIDSIPLGLCQDMACRNCEHYNHCYQNGEQQRRCELILEEEHLSDTHKKVLSHEAHHGLQYAMSLFICLCTP